MRGNGEKLKRRIPFMTTSVDDWLDEKKKMDGAQGLWRIHDKLYDFTIWSRTHPGGKFWLDVTRGTDITEAFETHHFSNEAELLLQKYYKREATTPRNVPTTFHENGFYKVFKRKLSQQLLATATRPSLSVQLINDSLAAAVFLTALLGMISGITWTIVSGVFLGVLSASSHNFLHMKNHWRMYYFDLSLMSSREWKIRHVLSHHQYRNTVLDLEIPVWQPFFEYYKNFNSAQLMLNIFLFPVAAHVQFFKRFSDVLLSKKLQFHPEELISISLPLFLFVFNGMHLWEVFMTWNLVALIGSFVFCCLNSPFIKEEIQINSEENIEKLKQDFGMFQLSLIRSHPKENQSAFCYLNSFRGNVLHYLCPSVKCKILSEVIPVFEETIGEFGISCGKNSKEYLQALQSGIPQDCPHLLTIKSLRGGVSKYRPFCHYEPMRKENSKKFRKARVTGIRTSRSFLAYDVQYKAWHLQRKPPFRKHQGTICVFSPC